MSTSSSSWESHWERYAESAEENPAQAYRRRLIRRVLDAGPGTRIVDIGSGQGDLVKELHEDFPNADLLGLEVSQSGVDIASAKVPAATFLRRDLLEPDDPPAQYGGWGTRAVCSEVLEHVERPDLLLRNAAAYLAPGCRVVVTVPGGPRSAFDRHIGHVRHYTKADLGRLLQEVGWDVERVAAAGLPFFNLYKLLVIARGARLIDDVASSEERPATGLARMAMRMFDRLFALNLPSAPGGWQLLAVARVR